MPSKRVTLNKAAGKKPAAKRGGRKKGATNLATRQAREALGMLVEGRMDKLDALLDKVEKEDGPKAAFQCFMSLVEYHIPKLARVEHTGKDGGAIEIDTSKTAPEDAYQQMIASSEARLVDATKH